MWWGFSEALDLMSDINETQQESENCGEEPLNANILLIGQYDNRHVLKTIAQKYRHKHCANVKLNFYIYEPLLENIARELLFTLIALEPVERLGIAEKTLIFMELYGNSLLRPSTKKYLNTAARRLLNIVTDLNYGSRILPTVYLDQLKYKERDQLEIIFKYWASNDQSFNIATAWNERLRKELGVRYDSRNGVFDWDYHMRYHCYGAEVLKLYEYKRFREKGISFYIEDTDPCIQNNTLASAIFSSGSKILSYGYLGDITTGPYPCFGFTCEDEDMFKKINGQLPKSCTDITERNLMRIFYEIQTQTPFIPIPEDDNQCVPAILKDTSSSLKIITPGDTDNNQIKIKDAYEIYDSLSTHNCKLLFLPTTALKDYSNKSEYLNFFDVVFVSQTMSLRYLKPEVFIMFKPGCKIIIDTPKFLLNYRKENLEEFKTKLMALLEDCRCKLIGSFNHETDEIARFKVNK